MQGRTWSRAVAFGCQSVRRFPLASHAMSRIATFPRSNDSYYQKRTMALELVRFNLSAQTVGFVTLMNELKAPAEAEPDVPMNVPLWV